MPKKILLLAASILAFVCILIIPPFKLQFFAALLSITILFIVLSTLSRKIIVQYICIACFSLGLVLSTLELYYSLPSSKVVSPTSWISQEGSYQNGFYIIEEHLGFYASSNAVLISSKFKNFADNRNPEVIYDVVYSTDERGHRTVPFNPNAKTAVVFLGGSFIFGQGLNDEETVPYKVAQELGDGYQVFNLGVGGYGPHHILTVLMNDTSYLNKYEKIYFFYVAIEDHVPRIAGLKLWDKASPRYMLENGKLVRSGTFANYFPRNIENTTLGNILNRSSAYKANIDILTSIILPYSSDKKQLALMNAMISESEAIIRKRYPNSFYSVLLWGPGISNILKNNYHPKVEYFKAHDWLPNFAKDSEQYIIEGDGHPNSLATTYVSKGITKVVQSHF